VMETDQPCSAWRWKPKNGTDFWLQTPDSSSYLRVKDEYNFWKNTFFSDFRNPKIRMFFRNIKIPGINTHIIQHIRLNEKWAVEGLTGGYGSPAGDIQQTKKL